MKPNKWEERRRMREAEAAIWRKWDNLSIEEAERYNALLDEYVKDEQADRLESAFRKAVLLSQVFDDAGSLRSYTVTALNLKMHETAREWILQAIEKEPGNSDGHYLAGITFARLKQWSESLKHYQIALSLSPERQDVQQHIQKIEAQLRS